MTAFTDRYVAQMPKRGSKYRERDGHRDAHNLFLMVYPSGRKSWQWRGSIDGKETIDTLGEYPLMTLAMAREASRETKARLMAKNEAVAPVIDLGPTVDAAFAIYMDTARKKNGKEKKAAELMSQTYKREIKPHIGTRALGSITRKDLAPLIKAKYDAGYPIASNRLKALLSAFFNWCFLNPDHVGFDYEEEGRPPIANPASRLRPLAPENARLRKLADWEIRYLMRAIDAAEDFGPGIMTLLYTGVRRSCVFAAPRSALVGDTLRLTAGMAGVKNDEEQTVWLHPTVRALIPTVLDAKPTDLIFGVCPKALSKPVDRLRDRMNELAKADGLEPVGERDGKTLYIEHWTLHDFRTTANTTLEEQFDIGGRVRQKMLGHTIAATTEQKHYNASELLRQLQEARQTWGDYLDGLMAEAQKGDQPARLAA